MFALTTIRAEVELKHSSVHFWLWSKTSYDKNYYFKQVLIKITLYWIKQTNSPLFICELKKVKKNQAEQTRKLSKQIVWLIKIFTY